MSIDYRAELQRLVQAYDDHGGRWPQHHEDALHEAVEAARTTLAQPEPEGVSERLPEPSDELLEFWRQKAILEYHASCYEVRVSRSMALQAIAWCRQQFQPQPSPVAERLPVPQQEAPK
jgi:hypothetical protein